MLVTDPLHLRLVLNIWEQHRGLLAAGRVLVGVWGVGHHRRQLRQRLCQVAVYTRTLVLALACKRHKESSKNAMQCWKKNQK